MEDYLEIASVTKHYKKFKAVDNVSLTVNKGEFLTILGPSGSGKTSLLKLIAGFEEPSSGSIRLDNQDITSKKAYERNIGMLFQNYALFPHMTVFENIAYPLRLRKLPKQELQQKVQDVLKVVHLQEYASRYPKQLSGGQQQRVALARAIVFNPPLLLLDEPLGALDKHLRQQMQLEIKHIQINLGITAISVTHDQEEALTMSDRVCVMNHGGIEQVDTPQNLYMFPKNRFIAEFIGEINLLKGRLVGSEPGYVKIQLLNGRVITVKADGVGDQWKHKPLLVALRPENLQLASEIGQFPNRIEGKVVEVIYLGDAIKVKVATEAAEEITVKIPSILSHSIMIGKEIRFGWNVADATLIPDEPAVIMGKPTEMLV